MVGGDQRCESQVAALKRMLRRCNMLGRSSSKKSRCHIDGSAPFFATGTGASKDSCRCGGVSEFLPQYRVAQGSVESGFLLGRRRRLKAENGTAMFVAPASVFSTSANGTSPLRDAMHLQPEPQFHAPHHAFRHCAPAVAGQTLGVHPEPRRIHP